MKIHVDRQRQDEFLREWGTMLWTFGGDVVRHFDRIDMGDEDTYRPAGWSGSFGFWTFGISAHTDGTAAFDCGICEGRRQAELWAKGRAS